MTLSQKQSLPFTQHRGCKYLFNPKPDSLLTPMGALIPAFNNNSESVFHKMDFHSVLLSFFQYTFNKYFHNPGIHISLVCKGDIFF